MPIIFWLAIAFAPQALSADITIDGAGATFPVAVYRVWASDYKLLRGRFRNVDVTYASIGSGGGKSRLKTNDPPVDYIGTDSYLSDSDYEATEDAQMFPTLAGSVVLGYNVPGAPTLNLSAKGMVGIFSGNITMWDDPIIQDSNPGFNLPSKKIIVVVRKNKSGTTKVLTSALSSVSESWRNTFGTFEASVDEVGNPINWVPGSISFFASSTTGISGIIESVDYSMGYMGLFDAEAYGTGYFNLENKEGYFVAPTFESVEGSIDAQSDAFNKRFQVELVNPPGKQSYPLCTYTYMVIRMHTWSSCDKAVELYRYIDWFSSEDTARIDAKKRYFATVTPKVAALIHQRVLTKMTCNGMSVKKMVEQQITSEALSLQTWRMPVYIGVPIGILVIAVFIAFLGMQQYKINRALIKNEWIIPQHLVVMKIQSSRLLKSSKTSKLSSDASINRMAYDVGLYQGETISLRNSHFTISHKLRVSLRREFLTWGDSVRHINIARYYGMYQSEGIYKIVQEFCPRILQDVLQNEKFNLDDNFKYSISLDIVSGMLFLHNSRIIHGNLSSAVCMIDSKWNIRIMDWFFAKMAEESLGEVSWRKKVTSAENDDIYKAKLDFWTAPELLTRLQKRPNKKCDVYSFSIVLVEIFTREDPYSDLDVELVTDFVQRVVKDKMRPSLPSDIPENLHLLITKTWDEDPTVRPSFQQIQKMLISCRRTNKGVLDCMMEAMESYMQQLEEKVEERTAELGVAMKNMKSLLHQMLPPDIARSLMKGETVEPEAYDDVTIFFSDIVGFTSLSADSGPMDIVNLLNDLYTTFDAVLDRHDVYKVETIGDAYMVSSGLPKRNGIEHAGHIATMALELAVASSTFVIRHRPGNRLKLRAGIHTGSCAAGVVGIKMPRYCLFGDTVNTASRMESTSVEMKIQISEFTMNRLQSLGQYICKLRGPTIVKGKGRMLTYWLHGKHGFTGKIPDEFIREIHEGS